MIAHVDMDCFFCACEVKRKPALKGKPVIVGSTGDRGVVSAANYEAREFGVYSATPISIAREICPDGVFLPVDFRYYRQMSAEIMEILDDMSEDMEQVSVDEAYLELGEIGFSEAQRKALKIQKAVLESTGLTCSIGVSVSRVVAKIASDYKKPAGITVVEDMRSFLAPLRIEKIPGIGRVAKQRYNESGIKLIGDLAELSESGAVALLGEHSLYFRRIALGLDESGIVHRGERKSVSRERTFAQDEKDKGRLIDSLMGISFLAHRDLGKKSFRTVSVKIRYSDFTTLTRDRSVAMDNRLVTVQTVARELFEANYNGSKVRLLGVKLSSLYEGEVQTRVPDFIKT